MVGVPGRSKACNTCKQRKIACTLERPQCSQCIKSKRMCTGYHRERIFITNYGKAENGLPASSQKLLRLADARASSACRKKNDALPLVRSEQSTCIPPTCSIELQLPLTKGVAVRHAFRQQLLGEFIYHYMPDGAYTPRRPLRKDKGSWLVLVADLPDTTTALDISVLAMSTAKIGRLNDDPVLLKASLKLYVEGLWELQKALWDPSLMYRDETLAACMALWMYEVMECPSETVSGWISHFGGCERLVQLRGAEAHSSALGHQVFLAFRTTAIYQVFKSRQKTYLAEPEWTELPWTEVDKQPFDYILDMTAALANLFVQVFEMEGLESTRLLPAALKVVDRCWEIEADLRQVYKDFENASPGPLFWPELSTERNPADDADLGMLFPVAFHFPNLGIVFTCMIYWASLILLWAVLLHVYEVLGNVRVPNSSLATPGGGSCLTCINTDSSTDTCSCQEMSKTTHPAEFDVNDLPQIEPRIDVLDATRNICQSLEYCMREEMKSLGPTMTVIPLMAVIDVLQSLPHCSRELAWAKAAFERINEKGFRLMRYLDNAYLTQNTRLLRDMTVLASSH